MMTPDARHWPLATKLPVRLEVGDDAAAYYAVETVRESLKDKLPVKLFGRAWTTHGNRNSRRLRLKT